MKRTPTKLRKQTTWWQAAGDFVAQPLRESLTEQRDYLDSPEGKRPDWKTMVMLVSVAVMLTLQNYYVTSGSSFLEAPYVRWCERMLASSSWLREDDHGRLAALSYWTLGNFVIYVAIPAVVVLGFFRRPLSEYGAKLRGWHACWWVYLGMYLAILPAVLMASRWSSFQHKYPFYRLAIDELPGPRFFVWELLYAVQFVSLEFFFRGYMIQAGRKRFGPYVIFVMTIPYCMIHFGKPMPETLGAIVAGILLGFMALKTRSIWLGAALHIAVAWTMDTLAVLHRL